MMIRKLVTLSLMLCCALAQAANDIGIPAVETTVKKDLGMPSDLRLNNSKTNQKDIGIDSDLRESDSSNKKLLSSNYENGSSPDESNTKLIPLTKDCIDLASSSYGIHPDILYAILLVEGGTVGKTNKGNANGTKDLNLFQMNEINLKELLIEFGITREQVLNDGCLSAILAARHLIKSVAGQPQPQTRMDYLRILARYHSSEKNANEVYALKLQNAFEYLANNTPTQENNE